MAAPSACALLWAASQRAADPGAALCETAVANAEVALQPRQKYPLWRVLWRALLLFWHAAPVVVALPVCWLLWRRGGERWLWRLVLSALQAHGPLSVKFAQWASTRPDILAPSVCTHLAELQDAVKPHPFEGTVGILEGAFGPGWRSALEVEPEPVGSGCMAQVYRGRLTAAPGEPSQEVALKVRHPGAQDKVDLDLDVLWRLVGTLEALWPSARYLAMSEALGHFESFVRPQADLRIEAANLEAFCQNFRYRETGKGLRVYFPEVVRPFVADSVLVETYEGGTPLQALLSKAAPKKTPISDAASDAGGMSGGARPGLPEGMSLDEGRERIGKLCMDMFLQMLFSNNFIHGDLHPGNIHFRFVREQVRTLWGTVHEGGPVPELVVFDAGLAVRLTPRDRRNFVELFHAIAVNDGPRAGQLILERSPGDRSRVRDEGKFVDGVARLIGDLRSGGIALGKVRLGDIFSKMIGLACDHRVKLETSFVTVATSIIVIEGVGRQLNPLVDVIVAARPLLMEALQGGFKV